MQKLKSKQVQNLIDFFKLLWSHRMGKLGIVILSLFFVITFATPLVKNVDPKKSGNVEDILVPPSFEFWLGTDDLGRDVLTQVLYGARISLTIGCLAGVLSITVGSLFGLFAGFYGGKVEEVLMRIVEFFMMLPGLPLMIVLAAIMGPSIWNTIIVVSIVNWPSTARIVRSQVLSVKARPFVEASRCIGAGDLYLIFKLILPNVIPIIFAQTVLMITWSIYAEAVLSFLGLGDPTRVTWGTMLHFCFASGSMGEAPWWVIPPIAGIVTLILGFTFFATAAGDVTKPGYREKRGL